MKIFINMRILSDSRGPRLSSEIRKIYVATTDKSAEMTGWDGSRIIFHREKTSLLLPADCWRLGRGRRS
ncbi:MAG: hypothetical protein O2985_17660, partial [Proteobacteria bacterium]|nr:hypothetical protein [Pseudomonadota bacterium]